MRARQWVRFMAVVLILALAMGLTVHGEGAGQPGTPIPKAKPAFQMHFLNQGRVDAMLIVAHGEAMFIDAGYRKDGLDSIKYMKSMGITKLRYYVGTHAHKNHIGGAAPIIHQMRPDEVFIPHDGVKEAIIKYAAEGGERLATEGARYTVLRPGQSFGLSDLTVSCLGPLKIRKCKPGAVAENYNSLILRIDRKKRQLALLTGDTSAGILAAIDKKKKGSIRAEVLKNPHHNGAQPESLLKKIAPKIVAICHSTLPSATYRARLTKVGASHYAASKDGSGNFVLTDTGKKWVLTQSITARR